MSESMYKAKKYYIDEDGNMVKIPTYKTNLTEIPVKEGHSEEKNLTLSHLAWHNSGITFYFKDDTNHLYPMSDIVFARYIESNPLSLGKVKMEFLQRGNVYSIGVVGND